MNICSAHQNVDGLQSAFCFKIRLIVISSSAIANHDVRGFAARVFGVRVQ